MLRPTIIFTVIISTIGGLQLFTEPFLFHRSSRLATGGSGRQYQTVAMYLYEKAFGSSQFDFGYAAAIAWCLFLLIAVIALVNYLLIRRIRSADWHERRSPARGLAATRRRRSAAAATSAARGPRTYLVPAPADACSLFPLYWSFVVASHDNSALGAYPPVLTPGQATSATNIAPALQRGDRQRRLREGAGQLRDRRCRRHRLRRLLQRARRVRLREAAASAAASSCCSW